MKKSIEMSFIKSRKKRNQNKYTLSIDFAFIDAVMQGENYADK